MLQWYDQGRSSSTFESEAQGRSPLSLRFRRLLLPPALPLHGHGPLVAVDARGMSAADVAGQTHSFAERTIFVVDDPDISALRNAGVLYEFAPSSEEVPAATRLSWVVEAYGVDRIVRLESPAGDR
jgi:hypothetical protein